MKTASLLLAALVFSQTDLWAQNSRSTPRTTQRETMIIERDNGGNTTIEITNEGVYLNGEQIATRSELNNRSLNKKIIIRNNADRSQTHDYDDYYNSGRKGSSNWRRAVLGVFTDTRKSGEGALIDRISPNSAAAEAGLREGDIILQIDSSSIYNADDLTKAISSYRPNDRVAVTYNRNGRERQTTATLREARESAWSKMYEIPEPLMPHWDRSYEERAAENKPTLGVSVENVGNKIEIRSVKSGSLAAAAGLKVGDVITYIDNNEIETIGELQQVVSKAKAGDKMKIEVNRNGSRITRTVTFPRTDNTTDL
ncbi:MAG TPA: PDZ domain-containing protein [Flavipsychrobacter sp.]|nr:PDZ domain-containing protein [Flavipsychrobacter sp.]